MANQAWQITAPGQLSLASFTTPPPRPGNHEVLVHTKAVSLNFRDILVVDHNPKYPATTTPSLVPCCDGAGIVEEAGPGSTWKTGNKVLIHPNSRLTGPDVGSFDPAKAIGRGAMDGTLRQWAVWRAAQLIAAPEGLSLAETSTLYTAGVTGWNFLMHGSLKLELGTTVVTQGTGGVSCCAIMIAAAAGAKVIATSSSDTKLEIAKQLGVTHLVNYPTHPDWAVEVLRVTDGNGADIAIEVGAGYNIEQTLKAIRRGGLVAHVGMLTSDLNRPVNVMPELWYGSKIIQGMIGAGSMETAKSWWLLWKNMICILPLRRSLNSSRRERRGNR